MKKNLILLAASIALVLTMVVSGCNGGGGGGGGGDTYRALNPQGIFIPVETVGLAPRPDSLQGKTIYVCQGEADPVIMPALYEIIKEEYPGSTIIYYDRSDFGPSVPGKGAASTSTREPEDPNILDKVDVVLRGIGW